MNAEAIGGIRLATLAVILTGRCNLQCTYCYRNGGAERTADLDDATLAQGLELARRAAGPDGLEVIFSGGEPTLRFGVFARAVERLGAVSTPARPLTARLISNGTLLDGERLDFLVARDVRLNLSVDGIAPAQRFRGAAAIGAVDELLELVRQRHPEYLARRVKAVMTLLPRTVPLLADSVARLLDSGLREIAVSPALSPVPGWDDDLRTELATQLAAVRRRCERELAAAGEVPFLPLRRYEGEPVSNVGDPSAPQAGACAITTGASPVLDLDGRLYSCLMFAPSGLGAGPDQASLRRVAAAIDLGRPAAGNYARRADRLPARLGSRSAFAPHRRQGSRLGACAECEARAVCNICPYALLRFNGDLDGSRVPAFLCSWTREVARQRAMMPAQRPAGPARWRADALDSRRSRFLAAFGTD